jgi:hypothetical protein
MNPGNARQLIAFLGSRCIASGELAAVALKAKEVIDTGEPEPVLIFDALTSEHVEVDFRGSAQDVLAQLEVATVDQQSAARSSQVPDEIPRGPGRPKLGVIGREVTLLQRHWDWLNTQPGGASVTLRKLVEAAKGSYAGKDQARLAREATYRFMVVMAGNVAGFEEATRVLFAKSVNRLGQFEQLIRAWPEDVRAHATRLMRNTITLEKLASEPIANPPLDSE